MKKIVYLIAFVALLPTLLIAQDEKAQLEKERQDIQNEIKQINGELSQVKGQTKRIIGQYNLIERKIKLQNRYINIISKELRLIDDNIYLSNVEIYRLGKLLDTLKAQYSRSVVYAYKNRGNYDYLNFIFSANSFNDAIKRITYLKSYRAYREQQVNTIKETQALIAKRKDEQLARKQQKDEALKNQTVQANELEGQKKEKDGVLKQLKSQEKDLQKQLTAKKKRMNEINRAVDAIVKRLIAEERKKEEERKKAAGATATTPANPNVTSPGKTVKTESFLELNAEAKALGTSFENNRAKLPWPVDQGYVCEHYGPFKIDKIQGVNPGITICTPSAGGNVKAVFDGEVVSVFNIDETKSVMIRHGKYFTVYSNLSSVNVSKGSDVKTNQVIGKVAADEDDGAGGKLEFLLMQENKNLNPESWLRK